MSTVSEHLQGRLTLLTNQKPTAQKLESDSALEKKLVGQDGLGFSDMIDVVNPLQHIPVVSKIYQAVTGDEMGAAANIAGAALFGGPIGAGIAALGELFGMAADATQTETPEVSQPKATLLTATSEPQNDAIEVESNEENTDHIAFRLGIDTVEDNSVAEPTKSEQAAKELANAVKPQNGILLTNPNVNDVAMRALGGNSIPDQIYRQVQTLDPLYAAAVDMKR